MSRALVEDCLPLDIRWLKRNGWRHGRFILTYTGGSMIELIGTPDVLNLFYCVSGEPVSCEVQVVKSPMHFGGAREWLLCPGCQKRFDILYVASREFRCRRCNGLAYRTQHETLDRRLVTKAERLLERAGSEDGEDVYEKPKWMHWRTFEDLMDRVQEAHAASWRTPTWTRLLAKAELKRVRRGTPPG